jgi:hypothetical protein
MNKVSCYSFVGVNVLECERKMALNHAETKQPSQTYTQQRLTEAPQKKPYAAPRLTRQGTIEEITQQTNTTTGVDATFGFGLPETS